MTPEELFSKQNKILELQQDLQDSITQSVSGYKDNFYFSYDIKKSAVQTDFTFEFFIPEIENEIASKKVKCLEFKTTGYKTPNSSWSDKLEFMNQSGEINNVYAFLMMNSKDFTVKPTELEEPSKLVPSDLRKNTASPLYQKYEAVSVLDFFKQVHSKIIFPKLKQEAQEWPEVLADHKKIFNQLISYLGTQKTSGLTPAQTNGLLDLQNHYDNIKFRNDLEQSLSAKLPQTKIKI